MLKLSDIVDCVSHLVRARVAVWSCFEVCRAVGLRELCAKFCKRLSIISGPFSASLPFVGSEAEKKSSTLDHSTEALE